MQGNTLRSNGKYVAPLIILAGFMLYFTYDIYTLNKTFTHPDFITCYYSFRVWFFQRLLRGEFPLWNPFWGLGQTADAWATIPIDIYTLFEIVFGPQYHYFQVIQMAFILMAGFYVFLGLGFSPMTSAAGVIFYVMMPWVTFYYFYFINPHSFVANMLLFLFIYQWSKTEDFKYLFFITWTFILTMFGTKPEYWFTQSIFSIFFSMTASLLFCSHRPLHSIKVFSLAMLAIVAGILAHAWQLNILSRIISHTGRTFEHSLSNIFSSEMYHNLFLSIEESSLLKMLGVGLLLYLGIDRKRRLFPVFLLSGTAAFFLLKIWRFPELIAFAKSPVLIGVICGMLLSPMRSGFVFPLNAKSLLDYLSELTKTSLLFLLIIHYWFQEKDYETVVNLTHKAPMAFKILLSTLVWMGCMEFERSKLVRLTYLSILFVFLMRDHGQILLAYLSGLVWMPARDTYMVDFAVAILAVVGLSTLDKPNVFGYESTRWSLIAPISIISMVITIFSASSNFYYAHWFMEKSPPDYPYYTGIPQLRKIVHELRNSPTTRIYLLRHDPLSHTYGFGDALLEGVSQVTLYASTIPQRYKDWTIYRELGIRPEEKWGGYPAQYSEKTCAKLPKKNTLGYPHTPTYYYTVLTRPPVEKNALKLLGIEYVLRIFPKSGEMAYTLDPKTWAPIEVKPIETFIDEVVKKLDLQDVRVTKIKGFIHRDVEGVLLVARLNNPLPRAFLVSGVSPHNVDEFMNEMEPTISDNNGLIRTKAFEFPLKGAASITEYEPENVSITVETEEEAHLVLSDLFHPFWHAKVDGKEVTIIPAFYVLRAVKVPAGTHRVDFYCKVPYFKSSIATSLSVISLSVIAFLLIKNRSTGHRD